MEQTSNSCFPIVHIYVCHNNAGSTCNAAAIGQRYHGGGFVTGSAADHVQPYPLSGVDAAGCDAACSSAANCVTYVHSGTSAGVQLLYRMYVACLWLA